VIEHFRFLSLEINNKFKLSVDIFQKAHLLAYYCVNMYTYSAILDKTNEYLNCLQTKIKNK